ncbi:hypothetical protein HUG17_4379 [Dermatophagoides farinae]|uniref:Ionotropic glutamate receptor L-glutamate and glycine-binding domain-containing protein n=1 Tax=Dermatophagoides farinae TaxID=6954 RepID=A0A9D4SHJ2_DERFA|nr:hypothetical protein HUG17_4379 [Dermatophagoides farinae]
MSRLNLHDQTFRIGFNNLPPITNINGWDESLQLYRHEYGFETAILRILAERFNFTYRLIDCHDQYGSRLSNGSWSGLIGRMARHELDLGIGGFAISYDRKSVVDFLYPYLYGHYTFAMAKIPIVTDFDIFIKPFQSTVWSCLLITLIMICLLYLAAKHMMPRHVNLILISFSILLRQPYHVQRNHQIISSSAKIWFLIWAIMSMVLVNVYESYVFSTLTMTKSNDIDTIEKLAESCRKQQILPYSINNSYANEAFRHYNQQSHIYTIFKYMKFLPIFKDGIDMIMNSDSIAFIAARSRLELAQTIIGNDKLYLPIDGYDTTFFNTLASIVTSYSFLYQNEFNQEISYITNSGILKKLEQLESWRITHQHKKLDDSNLIESEQNDNIHQIKKISLKHLKIIFLLYLFGIFITFCSLIIEICGYFFVIIYDKNQRQENCFIC